MTGPQGAFIASLFILVMLIFLSIGYTCFAKCKQCQKPPEPDIPSNQINEASGCYIAFKEGKIVVTPAMAPPSFVASEGDLFISPPPRTNYLYTGGAWVWRP